jgi:hypothetical protein
MDRFDYLKGFIPAQLGVRSRGGEGLKMKNCVELKTTPLPYRRELKKGTFKK